MSDDQRIQDLVEEILDSRRPAEEVCRDSPELLPAVLERLRRASALAHELEAMFPPPRGNADSTPLPRAE